MNVRLLLIVLSLFSFNQLVNSNTATAQGLEDIIVETYYITDSSDTHKWGADKIGEGYVTYRIYAKMKPGYSLHSVFGSPGHPLILRTSTSFFNHAVHGRYIANMVWPQLLTDGLLMLDSWVSVGAGCLGQYAVLKTDDDTLLNFKSTSRPPLLQSKNPQAGIPITVRDGLMTGDSVPPRVTQVGLDSLLAALANVPTPDQGFVYVTENGGWGCLGGAQGRFPDKNYVCIGQFTTDGDFEFEFNIQIGSVENGVEQYVSRDPIGAEKLFPGLAISRSALTKTGN